MTKGDFRTKRELGHSKLLLVLRSLPIGFQRLPLAILEHQHPVVACSEFVGQLLTVTPADHVRLARKDEDLERLVGGIQRPDFQAQQEHQQKESAYHD